MIIKKANCLFLIRLPSGALLKIECPAEFPLADAVKKYDNVFAAYGFDGESEQIWVKDRNIKNILINQV